MKKIFTFGILKGHYEKQVFSLRGVDSWAKDKSFQAPRVTPQRRDYLMYNWASKKCIKVMSRSITDIHIIYVLLCTRHHENDQKIRRFNRM